MRLFASGLPWMEGSASEVCPNVPEGGCSLSEEGSEDVQTL